MPSLKDLKNRIASVKATQKITKAMQMVAAAKLRRAQEAAEASRPYAERMASVLANLSRMTKDEPDAPVLLTGTGRDQVHLLVVCTGERGLCGAFNSSIVRKALADYRDLTAAGKDARFLCVGRKGFDILRRNYRDRIVDLIEFKSVRRVGFTEAQQVGDRLVAMFEAGEFDIATLYYAEFRSVISQKPTGIQVIPAAAAAEAAEAEASEATANSLYEYEPDATVILGGACAAQHPCADLPRAPLRTPRSEQGRTDDSHGQRDTQRRRHDQPPHAPVQTAPARR